MSSARRESKLSLRRPPAAAQSLISIILVMLAATSRAQSQPGSDPTLQVRELIAHAEQAVMLGELQSAESFYRAALLEGWMILGAVAREEGRLEDARRAFENATLSAVEIRRPHLSLALVELQLGNAPRAVTLLRGLKHRNLADAEVRRLLPRALMGADQVEEAIQELEEVHILAPQYLETTYALARAYLGQKRIEEAVALFDELATRRPIAETYVLIGRTYRDFGRWTEAHQALEQAIALDPRVTRAHYYMGSVDLFAQGLDILEEAMAHFRAELEVSPDDPMSNLYLGAALVEQRHYQDALPLLERAARRLEHRPDPYQFLGRSYLALDQFESAVTAFRRALEIAEAQPRHPGDSDSTDRRERQLASLHYQLARALRQSGDEDAAAVHFAAAKQSSSESAEGSRELLEIYLNDQEDDESLTASTWPLALESSSGIEPRRRLEVSRTISRALVDAYFNLGVMHTKAGRFSGAARLYSKAAELEPDYPGLQYALGTALFNDGDFVAATTPLERAVSIDATDLTLHRMLALAWFNSREYGRAAELLATDPERESNPSLEYTFAVSLVRSGNVGQAEPVFARLLAKNADWPELNVLLGQAHAQQDDFESATRYLRRALELDPTVAEAQSTLGDIYLRQGDLDAAEHALRAEVDAHPADLRAGYTLAVVLDLNRKPDQALGVLRPLLTAQPEFADGRYLLGKILLASGAADDARAQLEAAAELAPDDFNIHYQLGQAYQRLGMAEKARDAFDRYRILKRETPAGDPESDHG